MSALIPGELDGRCQQKEIVAAGGSTCMCLYLHLACSRQWLQLPVPRLPLAVSWASAGCQAAPWLVGSTAACAARCSLHSADAGLPFLRSNKAVQAGRVA